MRQILFFLIISIVLTGFAHSIKKGDKKSYEGHPIIGIWSFEYNGCIETYEFLPDGTRKVTSNLEILEAAYTISNSPLNSGFYKIEDTVIKDNGKADCSGSAEDMTGDVVELYISFSPNGDEFLFCVEENFRRCLGPFKNYK